MRPLTLPFAALRSDPDPSHDCRSHCLHHVPLLAKHCIQTTQRDQPELRCMLRSDSDLRSDLELVLATRKGEPRAVEGFVRRMRCVPLSLAAQNARLGRPLNEHDIEDVSQEVLVLIWNKLGSFAGLSTLETWVYRFTSFELKR